MLTNYQKVIYLIIPKFYNKKKFQKFLKLLFKFKLKKYKNIENQENEFQEICNLVKNSKNLEAEIVDMVNRNFWELLLKI
jgi:hypothetical protein